jgi:hypothetical protein
MDEVADDALRTDPPSLSSSRPDSPPVTIPHLMALGEYCISFVPESIATAPEKPRPISEATSSTGSSSTQDTLLTTDLSSTSLALR